MVNWFSYLGGGGRGHAGLNQKHFCGFAMPTIEDAPNSFLGKDHLGHADLGMAFGDFNWVLAQGWKSIWNRFQRKILAWLQAPAYSSALVRRSSVCARAMVTWLNFDNQMLGVKLAALRLHPFPASRTELRAGRAGDWSWTWLYLPCLCIFTPLNSVHSPYLLISILLITKCAT